MIVIHMKLFLYPSIYGKYLRENYHNMVPDTYKVQTRAQAKAQGNAPTVVNTPQVAQKAAHKIVKLTIKTEKEKDTKAALSIEVQQPPHGIIMSPGVLVPTIDMPPSVRLPPKPPNAGSITTSPNMGPDPNMDIEENSPHQEGIITETYVVPDQSYLEQPQELIKLVDTLKVV